MAAPRVVIIGGGVGGVSAAQQLAKANFADVTVIDRYDDHANVCRMTNVPGSFKLCRQPDVRSTAVLVCITDFAEHMLLNFAQPWRCRRDYFEIPWSNVRIPVDPNLINNTTLPLQVQAK